MKKKVIPSTDLLTLTTKLKHCNFLLTTLPPYVQTIYNTFIKYDIDTFSCSANVEANDLICKFKLTPTSSSPLIALIRALENSKKQRKLLKIEAEDDVQICGFQAFNALKICLESFKKTKAKDGTVTVVTKRVYKKPTKTNVQLAREAGYLVEVK